MSMAADLRRAVRGAGRSIYATARAAGVPEPVLNRFMRGKRDIRLATADRLAASLGLRLTRAAGPDETRKRRSR